MVRERSEMLTELVTFKDKRGTLTVADGIPFAVKRAFWVYESDGQRGGHAHIVCEQMMVAVRGLVSVCMDGETVALADPGVGFYVPPGSLVKYRCGKDSVCLVLCSERYDPDDYIKKGEKDAS